jgi:phosphoribosylaminoimidazole-succinocarboxamide synthase
MNKLKQIYEGKAKILYETDDPDLLIQYFKDDATAFNRKKTGTIVNKGVMNNRISGRIFELLEKNNVRTHYVRNLSEREMLVRRLEIMQVEVVVRNLIAGSLARRLGIKEGTEIKRPLVEFYYKCDELDDPMVTEDQIEVIGWANPDEIRQMKNSALEVDRILSEFFRERGIRLIDFKLEFGRHKGDVLLGDEITPDSCRLWETGTMKKLDKDRFRWDMGGVEEAYQDILKRVEQ